MGSKKLKKVEYYRIWNKTFVKSFFDDNEYELDEDLNEDEDRDEDHELDEEETDDDLDEEDEFFNWDSWSFLFLLYFFFICFILDLSWGCALNGRPEGGGGKITSINSDGM